MEPASPPPGLAVVEINGHHYTPSQLRACLLQFWGARGVAAEKAAKVDEVLQRYAGREAGMARLLEHKYGATFPPPPPPPGSATAVPITAGGARATSAGGGDSVDEAEAEDGDAEEYHAVVIGSGPHALALVMRLLDDDPDTCGNFWIGLGSRPTGHRETIEQLAAEPRHRCQNADAMGVRRKVLVVDPSGRWMAQWDRQFAALQIPFLRSAFDAHPAAFQSQALKAFAEAHGRDEEFHQLEEERYPGYDGPFRAPGSFLFMDYCAHLVHMYGLENGVCADTVVAVNDVSPASSPSSPATTTTTTATTTFSSSSSASLSSSLSASTSPSLSSPSSSSVAAAAAPAAAPTTVDGRLAPEGSGSSSGGGGGGGGGDGGDAAGSESEGDVGNGGNAAARLEVVMASGRRVRARVVVAAMGPTSVPRVPAWAEGLEAEAPPLTRQQHPEQKQPAGRHGDANYCGTGQDGGGGSGSGGDRAGSARRRNGRIMHAWDLIDCNVAPGVLTSRDERGTDGRGGVGAAGSSDGGGGGSNSSGCAGRAVPTAPAASARSKALKRRAQRKRSLAAGRPAKQQAWREDNCRCSWDPTVKDARVLIVGGGLTSVHLLTRAMLPLLRARESLPPDATLAEAREVLRADPSANVPASVMLVARHPFVVKQFDLNIEWVSWAERPKRLGQFYKTADMQARRAMLVDARGGGSITPHSAATLRRMRCVLGGEDVSATCPGPAGGDGGSGGGGDRQSQAEQEELYRLQTAEAPAVVVQESVEVEAAMWVSAADSTAGRACWEVYFDDGERREFDLIWLATGAVLDVAKDPVLGGVLRRWPIDTVQGLPVLQPSLRWRPDCPLYVMGPYAQLQLGPDALNLAGSRSGSCRIDTAIRPVVRGGAKGAAEIDSIGVKLTNSGWCSVNLKMRD